MSEVPADATNVGLKLYAPGAKPGDPSSMTQAVIVLERRGSNWIGVRYSMGPTTLVGKR